MDEAVKPEWRRLFTVSVLLLLLFFCFYLRTLFHELFADDEIYLSFTNAMIRRSPWTELHRFFLEPANPWEFLPIRDLSYWADFRLFGDEPMGFHLTNLVWYGVSVCSAGWLFRELILLSASAERDRATILAVCGAAFFAMHPAHVEAVAWVASRKDLLSGSFALLSSAVLANGLRNGWAGKQILLSVLFLALAAFSKAAGLTQVIFNSALILAFWRGSVPGSFPYRLCTFLLPWGVAITAVFVHLQMGDVSGIRIENAPGAFVVLDRASRIVTSLSGVLLFPYPLGLYHDVFRFGAWHWLVSGALLLLGIFAFARSITSPPRLWMLGVMLMLVPWGVYVQLMPFSTWSLVGERFVFVSVAGLSLVLIDLFARKTKPQTALVLLVSLAVLFGTLTWHRIADWEFGNTLRAREFERNPQFHNAIRDRVMYTLLPEKRYVEAEALASTVRRDFARDVLLALVAAERAYMNMGDGQSSGAQERRAYCVAVEGLQRALAAGHARIPLEADTSYVNILRSAGRQSKFRYADAVKICTERR